MKTSASSFENPSSNSGLVVRSLHKPSPQETNIKSIFSQSAPVLDPQSTEYSSFSLSNSSSPPYSKPSQSYLTLLSGPSSLSEKEIKISHLFENKSEKLEPAEAPAPLLPSPVQDGKIIFSSTPISIPHTYNDPKSSVSSDEESEETGPLVDDKNDEFLGVFSSEESTDDECSWFEELKLKSKKNAARSFLGEEERNQSTPDDQGESSFTLKSKLPFHNIKHSPISPISPFVLDPAKKELSESEDF